MPTRRGAHTRSILNEKIYAIGGLASGPFWPGLKTVEEYNPVTDTWTTKAEMSTARWGHSASVVDGKIYVIGGAASVSGTVYSTVEMYDPATGTWTPKVEMTTARVLHSTSVVNGKIYAIGGLPCPGCNAISTVEEYDPGIATSVEDHDAEDPTSIELHQNYPNPFNPEAKIRYEFLQSGRVVLRVFNMLGKEVRTLVNAVKPARFHEVLWDEKAFFL